LFGNKRLNWKIGGVKMELSEKAIGFEKVQAISPYNLSELTELRIISKPNQHTQVSVSGIIPESQKDSCIEKATTRDVIEIHQVEAGKKAQPLFKGVVTNISVKTVRGVYFLTVEALSNTYLLDIKLKNRSFQNQQLSYVDLFKTVLADYSNATVIDRVTNGAKLEKWAIQFRESDWAFLKRQASRLGAVLIPDHTSASPRFWIGLPEGQERQIENFHFSMGKNLAQYRTGSQNFAPKVSEIDYVSYKVESNQVLSIGDRVNFRGVNLVIAEATASFCRGMVKHEYILTLKDGIHQNYAVNRLLAGVSLPGKVIDRRKDQVRIHLQIDATQNIEEACWFTVVTPYTAEGNSGCYWMPELNDIVHLYFRDNYEENAIVLNSLRQNGATNAKTAGPDIKYLGTAQGKELQMDARQLKFTAKTGTAAVMFIKLDAEDGVEIQSEQLISVTSDADIVWDAKTISIDSAEGVYVVCNQSSIVIDGGGVDFKADRVRVEGLAPPVENSDNSSSERERQEETTTGQEAGRSDTQPDAETNRSDLKSNEPSSEETTADEDETDADILGAIPQRIK
jgi:phage baseplate assembly protein gpV